MDNQESFLKCHLCQAPDSIDTKVVYCESCNNIVCENCCEKCYSCDEWYCDSCVTQHYITHE